MEAFAHTCSVLRKIRMAHHRQVIDCELVHTLRDVRLKQALATPCGLRSEPEHDLFLVSWPDVADDRYLPRDAVAKDPLVRNSVTSLRKTVWDGHHSQPPCSNGHDNPPSLMEIGLRTDIVRALISSDGTPVGLLVGHECETILAQSPNAVALLATFAFVHSFLLEASQTHSIPKLTSRERDCLSWASKGKTDWEISQILGIAEPTVKHHLSHVLRKLGGHSRTQAVATALRFGIIQ